MYWHVLNINAHSHSTGSHSYSVSHRHFYQFSRYEMIFMTLLMTSLCFDWMYQKKKKLKLMSSLNESVLFHSIERISVFWLVHYKTSLSLKILTMMVPLAVIDVSVGLQFPACNTAQIGNENHCFTVYCCIIAPELLCLLSLWVMLCQFECNFTRESLFALQINNGYVNSFHWAGSFGWIASMNAFKNSLSV